MACTTIKHDRLHIHWDSYSALPALNGEISLGYAGPLVGITNNILVVAGGANFPDKMPWAGGAKKYYNRIFVSDINGNTPFIQNNSLPEAVAYSASCSTPLGIISAGGENEQGLLNRVFLLLWTGDSLQVNSLPDLPNAVTNAAAVTIGSKVFVAGGEIENSVSAYFLMLDVADTSKGWQYLKSIPHAVSHTILVAAGDKQHIYLLGGRKKNTNDISDLYNNVYEYSVAENSWTEKEPLPYALSAGTGAAIGEHYIALFGGDKGGTFHATEMLINKINNEKDSAEKQKLVEQKIQLQSGHPGFSNTVLLYDGKADKWCKADSIPFTTAVTTTAVRGGNTIFIPSGEIKAGVRTPQVLVGKIE